MASSRPKLFYQIFKRRGGRGSKSVWTMLKTAKLVFWGIPKWQMLWIKNLFLTLAMCFQSINLKLFFSSPRIRGSDQRLHQRGKCERNQGVHGRLGKRGYGTPPGRPCAWLHFQRGRRGLFGGKRRHSCLLRELSRTGKHLNSVFSRL